MARDLMGIIPSIAGLDTSCLVALVCEWHQFHTATLEAYQRLRRQGTQLVVAGHALLECFSVLTRLPAPHRVPPDTAEHVLRENFSKGAKTSGLMPSLCWSLLREMALRGLGGGRVYDAAIALSTFQAGARLLLTWNVKDFLAVAPANLEIREPSHLS